MRRIAKTWTTLIVALGCVAAVAGERQVDQTIEAAADGTVGIELISGSVRFVGWSGDEIRITGTLGRDVEGLDVRKSDNSVRIEVELVERSGGMHEADADLEIRVPADSRIEAESVSADLEIEGIRGEVSIESVNGEVQIRGEVTEAEVATVSSDVHVASDGRLRDGRFETVSGSIEFEGALDPTGRFDFEAVSGDITLRIPAGTAADFDVETFSGTIVNELGPEPRRTSEHLPSKSLAFSTGAGGARVSIESFSGTVRILGR
ncbi:MAG TPA: DUF4097 family beta strand repeat-containing protein [Candidatus Polarisedimenticolaceae bacterium]|nr:DUF4097 family beta strand repeat-containing protein [Candidatus Polarisedimenticolaceae bacterium]